MKKEYLKPEAMISLFDTKDVITASIALSDSEFTIVEGKEPAGFTIPYDTIING